MNILDVPPLSPKGNPRADNLYNIYKAAGADKGLQTEAVMVHFIYLEAFTNPLYLHTIGMN